MKSAFKKWSLMPVVVSVTAVGLVLGTLGGLMSVAGDRLALWCDALIAWVFDVVGIPAQSEVSPGKRYPGYFEDGPPTERERAADIRVGSGVVEHGPVVPAGGSGGSGSCSVGMMWGPTRTGAFSGELGEYDAGLDDLLTRVLRPNSYLPHNQAADTPHEDKS